ncbi:Meiosis protein mei2 [Mycena venus]|uniref:Meiosis protein mei2 n=1 Tax=Mycena venus TaxID=2733690 RepID=A0A8H7D7M1_9AGAR|nr:Meiosis protein mei2 [Mycena venus]
MHNNCNGLTTQWELLDPPSDPSLECMSIFEAFNLQLPASFVSTSYFFPPSFSSTYIPPRLFHSDILLPFFLVLSCLNPPAPSNLSIDGKQPVQPHPPRLQHSPSMPNIWFPPHSGPIPPRLIENCRELLKRPPSPLSSSVSNALKTVNTCDDSVTRDAQIQADGVDKEESSQLQALPASAKSNRRRRLNYDQPNALITPPLTPSSSIRTAGSIESSVSYNTGVDSNVGHLQRSTREEDIGFTDPDTISTRFLLLRNVSRKVTSEGLQFAILRTLTAPHTITGTPAPPTNQSSSSLAPTIDSIKGVLLRYHESHGIAILAFYDVRQAKSAQTLLSTPTDGALADCVGEEVKLGVQRGWLDCSFVTVQDLAEMVGKSSFLAETQGSFLLAVEVITKPSDATGSENAKRDINIATVISLLKAYGGVRSFSLASDNQQTSSRKVFYVEFFDVREANAAYPALNGQVLFGMRLATFGHDSPSLEGQASSKTADSESCIPFPSSHSEKPHSQLVIRFEPAGQKSQMRERFLFIDTAGKARPRSISDGHESFEGSLNPSVPVGASDSPPYFYTSPPTSPSNSVHPPRTPDSHSRRASNHLFFDARSVSDNTPKRPRSASLNSAAGVGREHERQEDLTVITPLRTHDQDTRPPVEHFYPPMDRFPQAYHNGGVTPPLPSAFPYGYLPHPAQLMPHPGMAYGCPPSPFGYPYEYDPQAHAHNMTMGNWTFEQAMMVPGMYPGFHYPSPNGSPVSEYWQGPQTPSPQHTAYFHYPSLPPDSPPMLKLQPPPHPPLAHPVHLSLVAPPSPAAAPPSRAVVPSSGPPVPANNSAERNQLNLARIEDGQDTRTTVMIKNIPNKMSDKDLMAYIGSVCVRKIDFLYLRMDFQNGCNVGYAFVNFITVQDLLRFAKAKLGEKWNMFSSEKVLQMSYANYQGKEALVEKFKNSCIMSEKLAWQPKIFYSDGPEQGLPEPFPAPTHLRRKERSLYNRGPLYAPGMMSGLQSSLQNRREQGEEHRDRSAATRYNERPRRLRDVDDHNVYSLAQGMTSTSLIGKKPNKK